MGWLDKYDDEIIAQGGETIPLSREDYLRQQYQNHLKEEANKGRQAVQKGMYEAGRDYLAPAMKIAGSFTPAGPIIGLMDAKQAWDEGSRGWAIAGAAAEALPYAGKVISKPAIKITKDVAKALKHNSPSDLLKYNKFAFKLEDIPRSIEEIKELNKIKDRIKNASTTDLIDWKKSRMLNKSVPNYDNTFQEFKKDLSKVLIDARSEGRSIPVIHGELEDAYLNFDALHPSPSMYVKKIKYPKVKVIDDIDRSNVTGSWKNRTISSGVTRNNEAVSPFETGTVLNHELDHYVSFPTIEDNIAMENFLDLRKSDPYYIGKRKSDPYNIEYTPFFDKKGTEIKARLGQIKDLLGKTGNEQVTKPQLRAALKVINNQNKYNIDNNMLDTTVVDLTSDNSLTNIFNYQIPFFRRVKDKNKMLQYMNDATSSPVFTAHKQGGIIPKAQEGTIFNKTNTQMKNTFATGGQMRNATNSQFVPSYVNGVPVYGFGSWLKKNAGNVLQVAGGVGAMFIPGMQGIGATLIGNGVTGALGQELQDKQQKDAEAMQRADAERKFMLDQYNDSQQVFASPEGFAKGGSIHIDPSKRGTFTVAATKHGQSVQGFASQVLANKDKYSPAMVKKAVFAHNFAKANGGFVPTYEQGGFMNGLKFYNDGGDIDGLTYFPVGGTHESNPNNGIPLGGNALVEEGEFMWESPTRGKYIFSNRF